MGSRADFYVGRGEDAEWLGSIAWDGYPEGVAKDFKIMKSKSEKQYRKRIAKLLAADDSAIYPGDGWPWPWEDSHTTDFSYAWDGDRVYATCFGHGWLDRKEIKTRRKAYRKYEEQLEKDPDYDAPPPPEIWDEDLETCVFPNMKNVQNVTLGKRSGLMVFEA